MLMKKKICLALVALLVSLTANAQFEKEKMYFNASLSGFNLRYSGNEKCNFGIQGTAGYFLEDNIMLLATVGYNKKTDVPSTVTLGAGGRYYFQQNGIYCGAGIKYVHVGDLYDDFMPNIHVGYAFFLGRQVTIEPEVYYNQSFKSHKDYSTIGFRIGVGVYL